jgi:hypothetical protein
LPAVLPHIERRQALRQGTQHPPRRLVAFRQSLEPETGGDEREARVKAPAGLVVDDVRCSVHHRFQPLGQLGKARQQMNPPPAPHRQRHGPLAAGEKGIQMSGIEE